MALERDAARADLMDEHDALVGVRPPLECPFELVPAIQAVEVIRVLRVGLFIGHMAGEQYDDAAGVVDVGLQVVQVMEVVQAATREPKAALPSERERLCAGASETRGVDSRHSLEEDSDAG